MLSAIFGSFLALLSGTVVHSSEEGSGPGTEWVFRGRVLDCQRGSIPGARITLLRSRPGSPALEADANGEFSLPLGAGTHTLRIAAAGFRELSANVQLPGDPLEGREFVLDLAANPETIVVTEAASGPLGTISSSTRTPTPLRDVPQSVTIVTGELIKEQAMASIAEVVRYVPGVTAIQGENNRDQLVMRGNSSSADFFLDGIRDDVQYFRDLYNLERIEALKGPNAMAFGRGGGGGVINRVTKEAIFTPVRELTLLGGSFGNTRVTGDFDRPLGRQAALRFNGMAETAGSFREAVDRTRQGINPTLTLTPGRETRLTFGYEYLHDRRVADRGVPSWQGRPADVPDSTFFGNPAESWVRAGVHLGSMLVEHQAGAVTLRNRTRFGDYDRGYQNWVPGAVTADQSRVAISAYSNATRRRNTFNQSDLVFALQTGRVRHMLLAGGEVGRQVTDNFRNTGYFEGGVTSILVPYARPAVATPATFRQSATDADNHVRTGVAAGYLQDQIELVRRVQVVAGVRVDHFDLRYRNNRNADVLRRIDAMVSPRAGLVFKPVTPLSVYASYNVSYLPSSGDQFSSLTSITQQVKPEKFSNYEAGVKWDVGRRLAATAAAYRLDRTNTRAIDPNDPTRIVQTGSQRTRGYELACNGALTSAWKLTGGYAYQDARVTSATASARAGARVAQVPRHTVSLWNTYQLLSRLGLGLGVLHRSDMYAAIDNTVVLPGYVRADAALFLSLRENLRLQANVENLLDRRYTLNADSNNNISPGSGRALRVGLIARF